MSYEEFLITDRGISLLDNIDIRFDEALGVLVYHEPSGTLLSKEFIENNNRIIEEELSMIDYSIENMKYAIEYKDDSALVELNDLCKLRHEARKLLYEFRGLVDRMY